MDCYPDEPVKAEGSEGSQMQKNHIQNKSTYIRCPEQANPSSRDRFPGQGGGVREWGNGGCWVPGVLQVLTEF